MTAALSLLAALLVFSPSPMVPTGEATTVSIVAPQQTLTLGTDTAATLAVTVSGPLAAAATPGRTRATVGTVGPLVPGPTVGSFTVEYRVPADRVPQSAIVLVEVILPDGQRPHTTTRLVMPAATNFPLRTSPHANVSIEIAGRVFGPHKADADGNVTVPIVVPPQAASGRARAINKFGIENETDIDLQPRDYPRVLLLAPLEGEAGATVDVEAWALDSQGEPSPPEAIDLQASAGAIRRLGGTQGVARFSFTLPANLGPGAVTLAAAMDDGTSMIADTLIVRAGAAAEVVISSDSKRLVVGSGTTAHLTIVAQDRFGNAVSIDGINELTVAADGAPLPVHLSTAQAVVEVPAPANWAGRDHVTVEARLGSLRASIDIMVTGGIPARLRLASSHQFVEGNDRNAVQFMLEITDERGTPTSANRVVWQTEDDGTLDPLPSARFGSYAVRFVPRRTLRDRAAEISVTVDGRLEARADVGVEASATRTAAARVGVLSNVGKSFGQTAFVEATVPMPLSAPKRGRWGRLGRMFSVGLAIGYLHNEATTRATGDMFPGVEVKINQVPVLALARLRLPGQWPVEFSLCGMVGATIASTIIFPPEGSRFSPARGTAHALAVGGGADASFLLQPGELVVGARYLHAELGRTSNGDRIEGNALGVIVDVGFRMGF